MRISDWSSDVCSSDLPDLPTALVEKKHDRPDLIGPLGIGSTASQTFLLEYLVGMPMETVGWGRVTSDQIETRTPFHPIKFHYETGPDSVNSTAARALMPEVAWMGSNGAEGRRGRAG